jgi:hypothetical protein
VTVAIYRELNGNRFGFHVSPDLTFGNRVQCTIICNFARVN